MLGSVVLRSGGTPAIESPGNAEAWPARTVRQPSSRWPSWPATRSTSGAWSWMRRARSLQRTCALFSPQTKGRKPTVCPLARDWRTFIVRDVLRTLLGGYLDLDPGRSRFCYGPHGKLVSIWIQKESRSASHSLAISPSGLRDTQLLSDVAPDFGTGRLPAFRHALDTITCDKLHA
jgi:hypothetical protein